MKDENAKPNARVVAGETRARRRVAPSLFGPIILIAIGLALLLDNFDILPPLNWEAALRLWPILLIGWGLNLILRQVTQPLGALFSAGISLATVVLFAYVLLFAESLPFLGDLSTPTAEVQRNVPIQHPLGRLETADVDIELGSVSAELYALSDNDLLIDGTISTVGEVVFDVAEDGTDAQVELDTRSFDLWFLNPSNWAALTDDDGWRLGLNDTVLYDLHLDMASGSARLDLSDLQLSALVLDGASGSMQLTLPPGAYSADVDGASGSMVIRLPASGDLELAVDAASGSVVLVVPDALAAQVTVDRATGSFSVDSRWSLFNEDGDREVWRTDGYVDADEKATITIDGASGSIRVTADE